MSKKTYSQHPKVEASPVSAPWLSMRTGVRIIVIVSIAMTIMTAWQAVPIKGVAEGVLWGVASGIGIWVIFFGSILFHRWMRGNKQP